jgi:hypothetical protein
MGEENLLNDNEFLVKVKVIKDDKEEVKEIKLRPYSFAIQSKVMESGLLNNLTALRSEINIDQNNPENTDFVKLGKVARLAAELIYEMLPKEILLTKTLSEFMEDIVESEPMRFIPWLMGRFERTNSFLAPAPKEQGAIQ